jgi:hypothetical protein
MKLQFHHLQRGLILLLLVTLWAAIESVSAVGAFAHETNPVRGIQLAVLTVSCAAIAFVGFGLAGRLKDDERGHIRARARAARIAAVCFLFIGPIPFFGSALKAENQAREWAAYHGSPAYESDRLTALDPMADRYEREAARQRLVRPANANLDPADAEFWVALVIQGLLIFSSDALRVPAPITAEERLALLYKLRGQKAAATRKRRKAAQEARKGFRLAK